MAGMSRGRSREVQAGLSRMPKVLHEFGSFFLFESSPAQPSDNITLLATTSHESLGQVDVRLYDLVCHTNSIQVIRG
jgi:hypothetical protein